MHPVFLAILLSASPAMAVGIFPGYQPPENEWAEVVQFYGTPGGKVADPVPEKHLALWREFVVLGEPGPRPPLGNEALADLGYLDVSAEPFSADPTGTRDCTAALNAALRFANIYRLAVFFPPGDYLVSDTLHAPTLLRKDWDGRLNRAGGHGPILVGSTRDPERRARIVLAPKAPGFGNPDDLKAVLRVWRPVQPKADAHPQHDQNTDAYDFLVNALDIVIGPGNDGAVALRFHGAEGCVLQDVRLDLTKGGHTGLAGLPGSGGSVAGLTVLGGRVGIDSNLWRPDVARPGHGKFDGQGSQPGATVSELVLKGQTEWAIRSNVRGQLVIAGLDLRTAKNGPVIDLPVSWGPFENVLAVVDGRIDYATTSPDNSVIAGEKSFYFENVYVRNAARIGGPAAAVTGEGWSRVLQLAYAKPAPPRGTLKEPSEAVWLNGREHPGVFLEFGSPGEEPPADLLSRHGWGEGFPTFETPGIANVRAFGAVGDGVADDTDALERAVAASDVVFIPKGTYRVSRTLQLAPHTKLIGVHHSLSILTGRENAKLGRFGGPNENPDTNGRPVIATADSADATTVLAFFAVTASATYGPHDPTPVATYSLDWRAGGQSMVRVVEFTPVKEGSWNEWAVWQKAFKKSEAEIKAAQSDPLRRFHSYTAFPERPGPSVTRHSRVKISGNGGGKWWNFWCHGYFPYAQEVRILEVRGNKSPLAIYHLHGQHTHTPAVFELNRARDVAIYGNKTEMHGRFLDMIDSEHIRIYGMGGAFGPGFDEQGVTQPFFRVVNSRDWLIAAMGQQVRFAAKDDRRPGGNRFPLVALNWATYPPVTIQTGADVVRLPGNLRPVLLQAGNPLGSSGSRQ